MKRRPFALLIISMIPLLCMLENPANAEVVYKDEHGVQVEYRITDTGKYVYCENKDDPDYTTKKIKIWKATVTLTNNSGRRIKPLGGGTHIMTTITVEEDRGSSLDYCFYMPVFGGFHSPGYPDQGGLPFDLTLYYPVKPGQSFSKSEYLYLYEDRKPVMTSWSFSGYEFMADEPERRQQSAVQAPTDDQRTAPRAEPTPSAEPASRPNQGPSGSLILLIDVSGSMDGAKLASAKQAAIDAIRKAIRSKTEIAVLAFEGDCTDPLDSSVGFTRNEKQLIAFVNGLEAQGGTPLATALEATNRFMKQHKSAASGTQMILLLADGDDDCGDLDAVLQKLKRNNLLYRHETVGLEVSDEARRQLQNIATQSGGNYHSATSENLSKVFSDAMDLMRMLDMLGGFN